MRISANDAGQCRPPDAQKKIEEQNNSSFPDTMAVRAAAVVSVASCHSRGWKCVERVVRSRVCARYLDGAQAILRWLHGQRASFAVSTRPCRASASLAFMVLRCREVGWALVVVNSVKIIIVVALFGVG